MGTRSSEEPPVSSPVLPPDLLLEVLARCDYETLVRCAASSKFLCRCMRDDPTFLRSRRRSGFAPSLLLGVLNAPRDAEAAAFVDAPTPSAIPRHPIRSFLSSNANFLGSMGDLLACGRGLAVFRRGEIHEATELCVCDPMTGRHCFLPPPAVDDRWIAILAGEDDGGSSSSCCPFQLFAAGMVYGPWRGVWCFHVQSQLFASVQQEPPSATTVKPVSAWGPVCRAALPPAGHASSWFEDHPVVINRVAHWLCTASLDIIALHIDDDGRVEQIRGLPRKLSNPRTALLASTGDRRRLSLVVAVDLLISVFVLSSCNDDWELHSTVIIDGIGLTRDPYMRLECFNQRSGVVVIGLKSVAGRLLLNLETKEVTHMPADRELFSRGRFFEMDLPSLIAFMLSSPSP